MRVLFDHPSPFLLAHGGLQTQIEQTKLALESIGVEVEHLRWWDDVQRGDIIHFFGRPFPSYIHAAQGKGIKVVIAELLAATGARSRNALRLQKAVIAVSRKVLPNAFQLRLAWESYRIADAVVGLTAWEAELMRDLFGAPAERTHVVPNGVEAEFFKAPDVKRGQWLVCVATIRDCKRVLELAEAAIIARTPTWIIGRPYSERDPYAQDFLTLAKRAPEIVRYDGPVSDRARLATIYREARGFVLLSTMESLSLAALEAAACECPLLLSDLPWARTVFGESVRYCSLGASSVRTAKVLREFYDNAPSQPPPPRPATWRDVALQLNAIYERVLSTSR